MTERRLRILVAAPALEDDRAAKVVARVLADAGHEVVYAGLAQSPEMIAAAAVQEAVDAVASVSASSESAVGAALAARGAQDIAVRGFAADVTRSDVADWIDADLRPRIA